MDMAWQRVMRFIGNVYPFRFGHSHLLSLMGRSPLPDKEMCIFVKELGRNMQINPRTYIGRHLYYFGTFDPLLADIIRQHLKPGMTFFDIGANAGFYSLLAAEAVSATGQVIAFEPQVSCCALFEKNMRMNSCTNVRLFKLGLSDREGSRTLYQLSTSNDGQASLSADGSQAFASEPVQCTTLDALTGSGEIPSCDVMKIDVEGGEFHAFKGASELFRKSPPKVICFEGHDAQLRRFGSSLEQLFDLVQSSNYLIMVAAKGRWHPFVSFEWHRKIGSPDNFVAFHESYSYQGRRFVDITSN